MQNNLNALWWVSHASPTAMKNGSTHYDDNTVSVEERRQIKRSAANWLIVKRSIKSKSSGLGSDLRFGVSAR